MSSHVYHEIYLHFNWHVKDDQPVLTAELEPIVDQFIIDRCRRAKGVYFHAIGGTETHIHLAINIEPQVTISELVKDLKGGSAHDTNQNQGSQVLSWQRGYGVVSFGKKNLPFVLAYIAAQKEHHAQQKTEERLERTSADEEEGQWNTSEDVTRSPAEAG